MKRGLLLSGALAALVYTGAVLLGGVLHPAYSQSRAPVSQLLAANQPDHGLFLALFLAYDLLVCVYSLSLLLLVGEWPYGRLLGLSAALALLVCGANGLVHTLFFPNSPRPVFDAELHLVVTVVTVLSALLATLLSGLWLRGFPDGRGLGNYSLLSAAAIALLALLAALQAGRPLFGVLERLAIGAFLQWLFMGSLILFRLAARPDENEYNTA